MLSVIANWIYVLITTYIIGFATLEGISKIGCMYTEKSKKKTEYTYRYNESYLIAGIVVVTVYAEIISLVTSVALAANVILVIISFVLYYVYSEHINDRIIHCIFKIMNTRSLLLYSAIFILMAYGTSHGLMHYDTDLYHAQAIRWIQEYGVIKGLGNIHVRLGYNSASFALSALYSGFFTGRPVHTMAGYFALLLAWQCADLKHIARRQRPVLSDFVRLIAIYYLFTIFDEMVSPASDYFMATMVFYIVIHWLDLYAVHERAFLPHALLAICSVYVTTIKLSAAPMMLLALCPIVRVLKKRGKEGIKPVLLCVLFCLLISAPYFARNVILTGWLVYPFPQIDLFSVAWKIPYETAISDAHEITAYGRGFTDAAMYSEPFVKWFPLWVKGLSVFNKMMLLLDAICLPVFAGCAIYYAVKDISEKKKESAVSGSKENKVFQLSNRSTVSPFDFAFIEGIAYVALAYFILTAPLVRYGGVYLWLPATMLVGRFFIILDNKALEGQKVHIYRAMAVMFAAFMLFKLVVLVKDDIPRFRPGYLLVQQEYNKYALNEKNIGGQMFYYPMEGDRTGYDPFPAVPNVDTVNMAGDSISDGFLPYTP
ncbi:LIC_10190 family membrane protein [Butyrivibrio sp. AE3004]|uniref:LIC_10190 family membrane protein n=1 Tax=Butyrivibrio sp. AE3004 TaxID=1506994 RepID=UPI000494561E|nr:hypothetical protein [Butyrivibrio sp. AE3004]